MNVAPLIRHTRGMATLPHAPRYPANDILSLLDVHRAHNLAESTSRDRTLGELCSDED